MKPTLWNPAGGDDTEVEVRRIQPYQARKHYICPGCNQDIPPGVGHVVAVPLQAPDLRRHWHSGCWANRTRRHPGRAQRR
jgi:hypothetical protein